MKYSLLLLVVFCFSCYPKIKIEGFDGEKWKQPITTCQEDKIGLAELVVANQGNVLGKGQAEIKQFLGQPDEHELYRRNQKFFYYNLTAGDTCENLRVRRLSVLFDALDRAKEVMVTE
ncbi:MAG: hypothetical protein ABJ004_00845 [Cyclobacteriaceae bacterium]